MKKYNTYNEIDVTMNQLFGDIFPDGIPNNSYIDKTKTALGLTYSEFYAKRNSIIIVPTKQIITDKVQSYAALNPFELHGESKKGDDDLKAYLKDSKIKDKKIVTTPDSFGRLIKVAKDENMLDELLDNYFCLFDEVHCLVSERYRGQILTPLKWFWKFKNKAVGSATPYHFSDPNFHKLDYFKLMFNETFGTITLVEHDDVVEALAFLLSDLSKFEGNIHIFLNSVELINRVINKACLKGKDIIAVFCADEDRNSNALGDNMEYFRKAPKTGNYAKVNFYSSKYNEGWDLVDDEKCTFVLATDVGYKHSLSPVQFKGFQAVGRLRSAEKANGRPKPIRPHAIYHITNTIPVTKQQVLKDFETVEKEWYFEANEHIAHYNTFRGKLKEDGIDSKGLVEKLADQFADVASGIAAVLPTKVDQHVYGEYYVQHYYNAELIKKAWEDMNYDVEIKKLPEDIEVRGESRREVNKRIIEMLELTKESAEYDERLTEGYFRKLSMTHKKLFLSYHGLGAKKLAELEYDDYKMDKARISLSNEKKFRQVESELLKELEYNQKYAKPYLKELLQGKYEKHFLYDSRMQIKNAKVEQMKEHMSIVYAQKGKTAYKGKQVPAIIILDTRAITNPSNN
ncbi:DEAD/DEAH box helicase family protein [Pedobacter nanyangensis]|uniref:DEAD/DEAH box helicase family protein n=1 Tax=Pedobacter nanyangensis TaxID=1562389 RepID=UPI000DE3216D|nr:DEAD/DEAH box helicase family protein [Pedobacter nanyangensis]